MHSVGQTKRAQQRLLLLFFFTLTTDEMKMGMLSPVVVKYMQAQEG